MALILALCLTGTGAEGSWQDKTAGQPILETFSAKNIGGDTYAWITLQDKLGRLFVGDSQLRVFDGQSWQSFPVPNTHSLKALAFGEDGRLWAGAANEIGYFTEETLGSFKYHSLIEHLPKEERLIGLVWGCAVVSRYTYFFCQDKIMRWDGAAFRTWLFPGKTRIFPLSLNNEAWFHHAETGLYRVTEAGPQLEFPAAMLPPGGGILGLAKDAKDLLLVSASGLYRPGTPPLRVSSDELTKFITESRPASFATLPDGNLAIGTVNGGMALVAKTGELLRILDTADGLPSRAVFSITPDTGGNAWVTTADGAFRFETGGHTTFFDPANGLKGSAIDDLRLGNAGPHVVTKDGVFSLAPSTTRGGHFEALPVLTAVYTNLLPYRGGFLLGRHGGMDFFDGTNVSILFTLPAKSVFFTQASHTSTDSFYLSETAGLGRLVAQPDGSFVHTRFLELPDTCVSLHEGPGGRLWIGTEGRGAFTYDQAAQKLSTLNDPATGNPFLGRVFVSGNDQRILFFNNGRVLRAGPDGSELRVLEGVPASLEVNATKRIPDSQETLIAFKHAGATDASAQGLGTLGFDEVGKPHWQELDVPALRTIGFISTMAYTSENNRPILWIGGAEGLLRLDYEAIPAMKNPDTPLIRLDTSHSSRVRENGDLSFPFHDHRLSFRVFTSDYAKGKDWSFQTRLGSGSGEWSTPSRRRAYEFTNLSEGDYRFEIRSVNAAGLASEPAVFTFGILPPWYRSGWAFAGYAAGLGLVVFVVIRVRERRIRARNEELEAQVKVRTEELVKASAAKDEFLAGISHEIRNPMNGVIGIAETFRTEALDPESRRKFGLLRQCATHLSSLLEDILDFSRVQAGVVELESREFDLPELVQSIAAMTAAESEKRGIPVEIAISPAVPARLNGDPRRIRQILLNFVSNALKFSGRGQISVTVWCKTAGPQRTEVIFAVSDEGPGISPEEQKRLFTRFERGAAAQQGRVPGTGLGLALCKGLAEKMGGRIWLESEPGEGSCFYFSAPFALLETAAVPAPEAAAPAPAGPPKVALVVDDEEYNRIVLTDLMESLGYTVHSAAEGQAALALAGTHALDVAFLDYDLPGLSGLEVARGIRALPGKSARALILATTAFTTPEKRAQCTAAGMNAFLGKPVTMERLRKALTTAVPAETAGTPPPARPAPTPDGLAHLRLIATRKGTAFAEELALFLSEFEVEFGQLLAALQREDAPNTGHYAHLLYGRCAFIAELELEQLLRKIEELGANNEWDEARALSREVQDRFARLRLRFASSAPAVQPG